MKQKFNFVNIAGNAFHKINDLIFDMEELAVTDNGGGL